MGFSVPFLNLQYQQQSQSYQQLLIRILPEKEKQQGQQQHISGIHMVQMKLIQKMPQEPGKAV